MFKMLKLFIELKIIIKIIKIHKNGEILQIKHLTLT